MSETNPFPKQDFRNLMITGQDDAQSEYVVENYQEGYDDGDLGMSGSSNFIELDSICLGRKEFFTNLISIFSSQAASEDFDRHDIERAIKYLKARKILDEKSQKGVQRATKILNKFDQDVVEIVKDCDEYLRRVEKE